MADVLCPTCGKTNPEDAEICQFCFTRLKEEEQPDWLSRIRERSKQEQEEEPIEPTEPIELPDWLTEKGPAEKTGSTENEVDWLANLRSTPLAEDIGKTEVGSPDQEGTIEEESPEWLQTLRSDPKEETSHPLDLQSTPDGDTNDIPDWLKDLGSKPVLAVSSEPLPENTEIENEKPTDEEQVDQAAVSEIPADEGTTNNAPAPLPAQPGLNDAQKNANWEPWPLAIDTRLPELSTPTAPPGPPAEEANPTDAFEIPARITGETAPKPTEPVTPGEANDQAVSETPATQVSKVPEEKSEEEQPVPAAVETPPDWLVKLQAQENETLGPPSSVPAPVFSDEVSLSTSHDQVNPFSSEDLPDWLARMSPPDEDIVGEPPETQPAKEKEEEITLAPAELPSWVQAMRPIETATRESPAPAEEDERIEKLGPLAGLRGILPADTLASEVKTAPVYPVNLQVTEKQRINAALFDTILSTGQKPHSTAQVRSFISGRLLRIVIALILLGAVWFPIWQGSQTMMTPGFLPAEIGNVQAKINTMSPGSIVLLAVDYNPALAGEVQAIASSVVAQLMSRSVDIVLISTNPMGPVLADQLLTSAQKSQAAYSITDHTLNLGYLAGGPSGLYDFAIQPQTAAPLTVDGKNAWEQPVLKGRTLADFAGVFVITESADTARTWVEQVKPALGAAPLFMVTSAQVGPMIRPYYDAQQIQGFVSGLTGGAIYEQYSSMPGTSLSYWDSYQAGVLIVVALIAIGGLIAVGNVLFSRQKPREEE